MWPISGIKNKRIQKVEMQSLQCGGEFIKAFLDHFFPQGLRESKVDKFMNLKQGKISVMKTH